MSYILYFSEDSITNYEKMPKKIQAIKAIRDFTKMGLRETKEVCERAQDEPVEIFKSHHTEATLYSTQNWLHGSGWCLTQVSNIDGRYHIQNLKEVYYGAVPEPTSYDEVPLPGQVQRVIDTNHMTDEQLVQVLIHRAAIAAEYDLLIELSKLGHYYRQASLATPDSNDIPG